MLASMDEYIHGSIPTYLSERLGEVCDIWLAYVNKGTLMDCGVTVVMLTHQI